MGKTLTVKRPGFKRYSSKKPFRAWLDEQPRSALTYRKDIKKDGVGWRAKDFVLEAQHRNVDVRFGTTLKWASGSMPRSIALRALQTAFKGITF